MARQGIRSQPREQDAGVVVAITPSGRLTLRSIPAGFPVEGARVSDTTGSTSGTVLRVFGPVARPYLSVRLRRAPRPAEAAGLIGTHLYVRGT
ncbi:MAG: H/ACA RNA-protein complex protein Gar1 [Thermoplasmata archaeon]|nr:H/ACA RNA-protein complex protein Gar1 [Thermoplasmata archaeon]